MSAGDLFVLLLAGHLIGDWVVQTDWMAASKAWVPGEWSGLGLGSSERYAWLHSVRANQAHMATYHLTMAAFVLPTWHTRAALVAFAVSWATHGFIDRRWPVRWLLRHTGSPAFASLPWGVISADQALHLSILALIAAVAGS